MKDVKVQYWNQGDKYLLLEDESKLSNPKVQKIQILRCYPGSPGQVHPSIQSFWKPLSSLIFNVEAVIVAPIFDGEPNHDQAYLDIEPVIYLFPAHLEEQWIVVIRFVHYNMVIHVDFPDKDPETVFAGHFHTPVVLNNKHQITIYKTPKTALSKGFADIFAYFFKGLGESEQVITFDNGSVDKIYYGTETMKSCIELLGRSDIIGKLLCRGNPLSIGEDIKREIRETILHTEKTKASTDFKLFQNQAYQKAVMEFNDAINLKIHDNITTLKKSIQRIYDSVTTNFKTAKLIADEPLDDRSWIDMAPFSGIYQYLHTYESLREKEKIGDRGLLERFEAALGQGLDFIKTTYNRMQEEPFEAAFDEVFNDKLKPFKQQQTTIPMKR